MTMIVKTRWACKTTGSWIIDTDSGSKLNTNRINI